VAIDAARDLNNGQPSALGMWLDALDLSEGKRVFHLGCGLGYYTALIAEAVGPSGKVLAVEVDTDLAAKARDNLAPWPNVQVVAADGASVDPGPCDAIMINAGVTHPQAQWLDRLQPAGRLMVPLTAALPPSTLSKGGMLQVERHAGGYSARFVSFVMIYTATSMRDAALNGRIGKALGALTMQKVTRLRRDPHDEDASCWLHGADFCLSF
jgi:protein-L-isoaspartate(D-aspartate) O-methyltransferase